MSNFSVITGFRRDHSYDGLSEYRLTLDARTIDFLISAFAAYITLICGRAWVIFSFIIHRLRSARKAEDGAQHQHRITRRNPFSQPRDVWSFAYGTWSSRSQGRYDWARMLIFALPPLLCFYVLTALDILSVKVVSSDCIADRVRMQPNACGYIDWVTHTNLSTDYQRFLERNLWWTGLAVASNNYARSCYGKENAGPLNCRIFATRALPYMTNTSAPCPFKGDRCVFGPTGAIEMATPWLDSHLHFGINAPKSQRILYKKVSTCSVLKIDDLITKIPRTGGTIFRYHLHTPASYRSSINWTFQITDSTQSLGLGYTIQSRRALNKDPYAQPDLSLIPDLNHTDADVSLFLVTHNGIRYITPVEDVLFAAHRALNIPGIQAPFYASDVLAKIVACTDQFQIRNPESDKTTNLTSAVLLVDELQHIGLSHEQVWTARRFTHSQGKMLMMNAVDGMGPTALKVQNHVYNNFSPGLPANQWQIEVRGWFETSLASTQAAIVRYVSKGAGDITPARQLIPPSDSADLRMCRQQLMLNDGVYRSFSVFGIASTFFVGSLVWIISVRLETFLGF